jgi:hypothetical protein
MPTVNPLLRATTAAASRRGSLITLKSADQPVRGLHRGRSYSWVAGMPAVPPRTHSALERRASFRLPFQPGPHKRDFSNAPAPASVQARSNASVVAEFAEKNQLSSAELAELRDATLGITVRAVSEIFDPKTAKFLRVSAIDPIIHSIKSDPAKSRFQNEDVTKLTSTSASHPFSNFAMHLAPGGQDGVHVHPFGPRNLVVLSDRPWVLLCSRSAEPGEDPATIKRIARVRLEAGQHVVSLPANRPHGFEAEGDGTVAYSIHAFDEQEVASAGVSDGHDVMSKLTRDLGSDGLSVIGKVDVPLRVVAALQANQPVSA